MNKKLMLSLIAAASAVSISSSAFAGTTNTPPAAKTTDIKCMLGAAVKAGMGDCSSKTGESCMGTNSAGDKSAWLFTSKHDCDLLKAGKTDGLDNPKLADKVDMSMMKAGSADAAPAAAPATTDASKTATDAASK